MIEKVAPKTYRATAFGKKFLTQHPSDITEKDLRTIPGWKESWGKGNRSQIASQDSKQGQGNTTPLEALDNAITTLQSDLRSRLLEEILKQSPTFFEKLVLDVLLAMGYGGSREDAAHHLGKSNDEVVSISSRSCGRSCVTQWGFQAASGTVGILSGVHLPTLCATYHLGS